ncbi:MAG: acetate--CoA ligase [Nannocystaceae bacterium]|nr:acetate--CoA ligase [Deltaproteobacteria bacterium]MBP7292406.1 acetate--CoA ligase [Nannocystaceae bacterium]
MTNSIVSVSKESRVFEPPAEFSREARVGSRELYDTMYRRSVEDPAGFWAELAAELHWFEAPKQVRSWEPPKARWFEGGTTNLAYNCLDRHVAAGAGDRTAIIWEGEPGEVVRLSYAELLRETSKCANALRKLGVAAGDRVVIYMGMVPEAVVAMLACARLGAIHSVIFGGFATDAVRDRVNDAGAKLIITQDGAWRRGKIVPLWENVERALASCPCVEHTLVLRRTNNPITLQSQRDHEWSQLVEGAAEHCDAVPVAAEHPLFILYTSGTTGKPKGVLHTTAGYMVGTYVSTKYVFDLQEQDVYWCTADIGWVTGHSYIVYGPLCNRATVMMYEGAPNQPGPDRLWEIIARHRVTIFYTAPTAIRAFIRWGDEHPARHDLSSLRLLGSVGEPINPEAWMWYREVIGGNRCPIVDTWWQTETGAIMMAPLPGAIAAKPGSCTLPFFGVVPKILRHDGTEAGDNEGGYLVIEQTWPSMMRGIWGDEERFRETYFARYPGKYFTGDGARRDPDGYYWVMGRVDDVVNVAGHRLGTAEIESVLVAHPDVAEAAVVGRPDELKGQALVAFVTLKGGRDPDDRLREALADHVAAEIGKFARPDAIRFADALPKTRSGKIMRRLLGELAAGQAPRGDVTTLEDISVLAALRGDDE